MTQLLVDLGGTHCRVGLTQTAGQAPHHCQTFVNDAYESLGALLSHYLSQTRPGPIAALCAGVAGPVRDGRAQLTNHHWHVLATDLMTATGARRVHLLNDLQAQAYALDDLGKGAFDTLIPGAPDPGGARLVLGLGTGTNIAVTHRHAGQLFVPPSESGHMTLPDAPGFRALFDALRGTQSHLPVEAALSGPGLTRLHKHLTDDTLTPAQIIAFAPRKTLQTFVSLLGVVAANLCISHMATGGLYLIGGTARAIAPLLVPMGFADTFHPRGPYTQLMREIPVTLITDDTAALRGCARYLAQAQSAASPEGL